MIDGGENGGTLMVLALSALMIVVGLAFKLSAVPFHFWCPDVFEGASAEVDAFLSIASKGAAMALLLRVALGVSIAPGPADAVTATSVGLDVPAQSVAFAQPQPDGEPATAGGPSAAVPAQVETPLTPVRTFIVQVLAILAAITCTFGNLAAYGQTNIKRLLAYSTIAHAGYMMMAVAAAVQLVESSPAGARDAVAALMLYLALYIFMNLGAFAIVAFLRSALQSEEIADYAGLVRSTPLTAVALTAILVSLIGIPPMAGFIGKLAIFVALVTAGGTWMFTLLVIAGLNTVLSLVYYLRVAKVVCIDSPEGGRGPVAIGFLPALYVLLVTLPVLYYGIYPTKLLEWISAASQQIIG
jgi:NADH-quinone oxidoreductase subunit N